MIPERTALPLWRRYDEDGFFPTTPGCKRAVREAVHILRRLGHEVNKGREAHVTCHICTLEKGRNDEPFFFQTVPFQLPHLNYFVETFFDFMVSDNGETTLDYVKGDILDQVRPAGRPTVSGSDEALPFPF